MFRTLKPIVITAAKFPGLDNPEFFAGRRLGIPTQAIVNRSFTSRVGPLPEECGDNGGGASRPRPTAADGSGTPGSCSSRSSTTAELLGLSYAGRLTRPLRQLRGCRTTRWGSPFLDARTGSQWQAQPIAAQLTQAELFDRNFRKWISIAHGIYKQRTNDWWATTTLHWEVSFTRLRSR